MNYTSLLEIKNGMEMNLAMLLMALLFSLLASGRLDTNRLLLLTTRFESPIVLLFLAAGLYFDAKRRGESPATYIFSPLQH